MTWRAIAPMHDEFTTLKATRDWRGVMIVSS
jgi:hypothetical protein